MDAAQDVFEFDELIRDFMYDMLWAKVNRDFLDLNPEPEGSSTCPASRQSLTCNRANEHRLTV